VRTLIVRSGRPIDRAGLRYGAAVPTRPYPFERLPRFTREQLRVLHALRSLCDDEQRSASLQLAAALLGTDVAIVAGLPESYAAGQLLARLSALGPCAFVLLESVGDPLDACLVVELSAGFAERLVDRTLGGDSSSAFVASLQALDELSRGVLAYLSARVVAALSSRLRVRHVTSQLGEIAGALGDGAVATCTFELRVGAESGNLRVYAPASLALRPRPRPKTTELGMLPLTLIAEVGGASLSRDELRQLRVADTLVLDHCSLVFEGARFVGHVLVHVAGSGTHLVCRLRDRSVAVESLTSVKEPSMSSGRVSQAPEARATVPDIAADAPLELSVELARFSLTLGELQRTRPGDVLVTGRAIGESVTLRVGGRAIAQGDLVDVDGEVGLRITSFSNEP
jgi:type III secretion system YscQ/HrcQ family protein